MNRGEKGNPVVYVTGERALDFAPAEVYGQLCVMDVERIVPYAESLPPHMAFNERLIFNIKKELASYVPDYDYICPVGSPIVMTVVGLVLKDMGPMHRFLGWDGRQKRYLEYKVRF